VIGASTDEPSTQRDFAKSLDVTYPMVGDSDRKLTSLYGALWPLIRVARRVTYVIDHAGVIQGVFAHELQFARHIDDALHLLDKLERERGRAGAG
jgi:peroxiredoxin